jgi:hypothetical protein
VQGDIGRVQVEDDLPRRRAVRVEEQVDEQRLDRRAVVADPVIAPGLARGCVLQPVQRALAGQRRTTKAARLQLDTSKNLSPRRLSADSLPDTG